MALYFMISRYTTVRSCDTSKSDQRILRQFNADVHFPEHMEKKAFASLFSLMLLIVALRRVCL